LIYLWEGAAIKIPEIQQLVSSVPSA
jgi:hypothetical protein